MSCVLSSTQGSAPLKPADVTGMVNHRKVGYGRAIAGQVACLQLAKEVIRL